MSLQFFTNIDQLFSKESYKKLFHIISFNVDTASLPLEMVKEF